MKNFLMILHSQLSADSKQILDQPIYKEKNVWLSYIHETK